MRALMAHTADSSKVKRGTVLGAVIAAHVIALAAALGSRSGFAPPLPDPSVRSLASSEATLSPPIPAPPPRVPSKRATSNPSPPLPSAPMTTNPIMPVPGAGTCSSLDAVASGLLADPAALASILSAPRETRSVADAIVVWNAHWSEAAIAEGSPLQPIRVSVQRTLGLVEQSCLEEPIVGPRLVPIPIGERTTFLVFGSGSWSWRELLPGKFDDAAVRGAEDDVISQGP
jgi:hypothetical protein